MEKAYCNVSFLFVLAFAVIVIAFFPTYFGLFPSFNGTTLLVHLHAVSIISWFAMLIGQPILITRKKFAAHRLVGKISYWLVPVMVVLFILMSRQHQLRERNLVLFVYNTFDITVFIIFYLLAIIHRKNTAYHARFMCLTVLPFFGATIGRLPSIGIPSAVLALLTILVLLAYEAFSRKIFRPYVICLVIYTSLLTGCELLLHIGNKSLIGLWQILFSH